MVVKYSSSKSKIWILHCGWNLVQTLLHKLYFINLSQKCLLRVEKYTFVGVKINEFLHFGLTEKISSWSFFTVLFHTVHLELNYAVNCFHEIFFKLQYSRFSSVYRVFSCAILIFKQILYKYLQAINPPIFINSTPLSAILYCMKCLVKKI